MTRKVTLRNIADALNVSIMTVSRAINGSSNVDKRTRDSITRTARELGYFPNHIAKSLVKRKTQTIGVIVPEITHSFFPEAIKGIEEAATRGGYQIMLTHSAEDAKREIAAIETLASKRVDGILASVAESDTNYQVYRQVLTHGIPVVFFDRCVYDIGASCVSINDESSAMQITQHLIEHRYKRIAHLRGPLAVSISKARLRGFKKALKRGNIPFDGTLVIESGFHESGGYKAMSDLLDRPKKEWPRAVVAVNDPAAFGAMKAIKERGLRIPEDIAIVGFSDDIRAELMPVPLTTVRQPAYEIGNRAALMLISNIENKNVRTGEIKLKTELVYRRSCGCNYHK